MQAFFKYDTQSISTTHSQTAPNQPGATVADATTNVSDTSFLFNGPAPSGSSHGSYLASPVLRRYSFFIPSVSFPPPSNCTYINALFWLRYFPVIAVVVIATFDQISLYL